MGISTVRIERATRAVCGALLLALLVALPCHAHTEEDLATGSLGQGDAAASIGVDERLGAKLPLDLVFRDETGRRVRLKDLISGPTIILPVYYSCSNVCNYLQSGLARVLPELKPRPGADYRVLSVSFDETETPELAARYQKMYLAALNTPFPPDAWHFLTGDLENIKKFTSAAGIRFQRRGHEFVHPVVSFVVTRDGMIVRYLYGTNFLAKDVTLALIEAREGRVGETIRKVVGYCFSFDPKSKSYVFNLLRVSATVIILSCGGFFAFLVLTGKKGSKRAG